MTENSRTIPLWASTIAVLWGAAAVFLIALGSRTVVSEEMRWAEIAREMVRLNGGRLSRTGEGFVLRMPRFPPPAVPAEEAAAFSL